MEQFNVASLNDQQLQKLKNLEEELDVVLIAYHEEEEDDNPGGKHTIVTG